MTADYDLPTRFVDPLSLEVVSTEEYYRTINRIEVENYAFLYFSISGLICGNIIFNLPLYVLQIAPLIWTAIQASSRSVKLRRMLDTHVPESARSKEGNKRTIVYSLAIACPWIVSWLAFEI